MKSRLAPFSWLAIAALASSGPAQQKAAPVDPREAHLAELRQLTFGGENAEAYWSPDGRELIFQSTRPPFACDQIFRLALAPGAEPKLVSSGEGRTTCAFFAGSGILYASTHLAGPDCPPPPDRSQGYVWAVHPEYEIFAAGRDGADRRRLTDNQAYDAEATVCARDGSIVFTSTRDGDLELYRMDAGGGKARRLTEAPGYDGGAFFSPDCSRIVWRASRPSTPEELAEYRGLLARGLVRPTRLELWTANADGSEPRQITYLGGASFAPSFLPSGERVIFSSNHHDPKGREFDLWAIGLDGTGLERVTHTPGFDGFPMFSPDGRWLAFASNRNQSRPGETNVFVARWATGGAAGAAATVAGAPAPADRYLADVRWLADDRREGRGIGTEGLDQAAGWLEGRFRELGLAPAGEDGFRQRLDVPVAVRVDEKETALAIGGRPVPAAEFRPAPFSASAAAEGEVVAAGYGIVGLGRDDYAGVDVRGKIALVRRFVPAGKPFDDPDAERRWGDVRGKAWAARERGAVALLVADFPEVAAGAGEMPEEAPLPDLRVDARGDAGLPVLFLRRAAARELFERGGRVAARVRLETETRPAWNIVGRIAAGAADRLPGAVVIGA
ncbi:MAG TPA: PA domain-containing protein, partial [Thermoanaerobaculia bacterium]|nr:PA domain-containing protein [Thermoanaerobaculia bacterium]